MILSVSKTIPIPSTFTVTLSGLGSISSSCDSFAPSCREINHPTAVVIILFGQGGLVVHATDSCRSCGEVDDGVVADLEGFLEGTCVGSGLVLAVAVAAPLGTQKERGTCSCKI